VKHVYATSTPSAAPTPGMKPASKSVTRIAGEDATKEEPKAEPLRMDVPRPLHRAVEAASAKDASAIWTLSAAATPGMKSASRNARMHAEAVEGEKIPRQKAANSRKVAKETAMGRLPRDAGVMKPARPSRIAVTMHARPADTAVMAPKRKAAPLPTDAPPVRVRDAGDAHVKTARAPQTPSAATMPGMRSASVSAPMTAVDAGETKPGVEPPETAARRPVRPDAGDAPARSVSAPRTTTAATSSGIPYVSDSVKAAEAVERPAVKERKTAASATATDKPPRDAGATRHAPDSETAAAMHVMPADTIVMVELRKAEPTTAVLETAMGRPLPDAGATRHVPDLEIAAAMPAMPADTTVVKAGKPEAVAEMAAARRENSVAAAVRAKTVSVIWTPSAAATAGMRSVFRNAPRIATDAGEEKVPDSTRAVPEIVRDKPPQDAGVMKRVPASETAATTSVNNAAIARAASRKAGAAPRMDAPPQMDPGVVDASVKTASVPRTPSAATTRGMMSASVSAPMTAEDAEEVPPAAEAGMDARLLELPAVEAADANPASALKMPIAATPNGTASVSRSAKTAEAVGEVRKGAARTTVASETVTDRHPPDAGVIRAALDLEIAAETSARHATTARAKGEKPEAARTTAASETATARLPPGAGATRPVPDLEIAAETSARRAAIAKAKAEKPGEGTPTAARATVEDKRKVDAGAMIPALDSETVATTSVPSAESATTEAPREAAEIPTAVRETAADKRKVDAGAMIPALDLEIVAATSVPSAGSATMAALQEAVEIPTAALETAADKRKADAGATTRAQTSETVAATSVPFAASAVLAAAPEGAEIPTAAPETVAARLREDVSAMMAAPDSEIAAGTRAQHAASAMMAAAAEAVDSSAEAVEAAAPAIAEARLPTDATATAAA
jgi:hypothetical protein